MPGLDRGADVVDVDVDVPEPVAADDDERVAERRRASLRSAGIAVVLGVEEVHHLVRRAVRGQVAVGGAGMRDRDLVLAERCGAPAPGGGR